jgi:uncharacterized protein (TIGR02996 family)
MAATYADAFLEAVLEDPEEPAHRLVYADWLEEQGGPDQQARAEFIRVQIELAQMGEDDERRPALAARERILLEEHGAAWAGRLARLVHECDFRRGFVERVRLNGRAFLRHARTLFRQAPLRQVDLLVGPEEAAELASCPFLARVAVLDLGYQGSDVGPLARLLDSPHLAGLTALRLRYTQGQGVRALAGARHLGQLETLDLGASHFGVEGLELLLQAHLPSLTRLHLNASALGNAGVQRLAAAPLLEQLTGLDLTMNNIDSMGVKALVRSPRLRRLSCLHLGFNEAGDSGVAALAGSARLASLTRLYLGRNRVGTAGVQALAASPHLAGLTHLDLDYNDIPAHALQVLAASPYLNQLQALYVRCGLGLTLRTRRALRDRFGDRVSRF